MITAMIVDVVRFCATKFESSSWRNGKNKQSQEAWKKLKRVLI